MTTDRGYFFVCSLGRQSCLEQRRHEQRLSCLSYLSWDSDLSHASSPPIHTPRRQTERRRRGGEPQGTISGQCPSCTRSHRSAYSWLGTSFTHVALVLVVACAHSCGMYDPDFDGTGASSTLPSTTYPTKFPKVSLLETWEGHSAPATVRHGSYLRASRAGGQGRAGEVSRSALVPPGSPRMARLQVTASGQSPTWTD